MTDKIFFLTSHFSITVIKCMNMTMTSAVTSFCSAQSSVLSISREARLQQIRDQRLLAISLVMRCPARHNYAADTQSAVECGAAHGARGGVRGARLAGVAICVTRLHPRLVQHRDQAVIYNDLRS